MTRRFRMDTKRAIGKILNQEQLEFLFDSEFPVECQRVTVNCFHPCRPYSPRLNRTSPNLQWAEHDHSHSLEAAFSAAATS
jgi:hypothetical protein